MPVPLVYPAGAPGVLTRTVKALKNGELVVVPTDTVYGLAVRADDEQAVERLYRAKGKRRKAGLAYLVSDYTDMNTFLGEVPERALNLARRFWPGQLTIVIKKGEKSYGFRCPAYPFALMLAKQASFPLYLTSANISGMPETVSASTVLDIDWDPAPALVINGGDTQFGLRSTVVMVENDKVKLMRAGVLPATKIPYLEQ
ncbi:MAG: L-threonylcarbamoyladenylate synthase [Planctomycetota bacterium]|nr:L-threonylcarbamoyladenylate synthase [Planctomycetota bacterium]